jgi:hypothetical protein
MVSRLQTQLNTYLGTDRLLTDRKYNPHFPASALSIAAAVVRNAQPNWNLNTYPGCKYSLNGIVAEG